MFQSCFNRGFHITFENGIRVSAQWGIGSHAMDECHKPKDKLRSMDELHSGITREFNDGARALTCEVMIIKDDTDAIITHQYNDLEDNSSNSVMWNVTPDELVDILTWARNW
jgi:hypothetical protein